MVARGRPSTSDNHCAIDRLICVRRHGVNQFLARRNIHGTFKQTGLRYSSRQLCHCVVGRGRCDSPHQSAGPQTSLLFLIMRCTPTIHELIVLTLPPRHRRPLDHHVSEALPALPRIYGEEQRERLFKTCFNRSRLPVSNRAKTA